jgi:proline iminopeptidase
MSVFTDPLSAQYQTITPDLRGYGKSRAIAPFTMADHLSDLEQLLDHLGLENCWVLGWSLGGILAMELALSRPDRVRGLILIATAARPRGSHPPITWQDNLNTGIASLINQVLPSWDWNIDTFGKRSLYRYLIQRHTPTAYRYLADAAFAAYLQTSSYATQALNQALRQRYDRLNDLHQIHCPSLVLAGDSDRHITAESSRLTAEQLPNSYFQCYTNVAHLFPWEIPNQVIGDIQTWLSQVQTRSPA